ncbi:ATP12 family chaperone protein, partial [[Ruminococcus] torques]|uniref:ATP12 family chaperone protein n=1 Tax=[Ruminococcus] torques TaxID=33039 RepID=UPI001EDEFFB9
ASKIALPKRFYANVSVAPRDDAFAILLDGRPVRTPRQSPLALPTREAADLVAEEWRAQAELIDPSTMPVTRLVNAAIDEGSI